MDKIHIAPTEETPEIILDKEKGIFKIRGVSIPENNISFYAPVHDWFRIYVEDPNNVSTIDIELEYCNTASSKQIYELLMILKKIEEKGKEYDINWYYDAYDDDIRDLGRSYSNLINKPFNLVLKS